MLRKIIVIIQKMRFSFCRTVLFLIRPFIGNRKYTKKYISLLRSSGLDIAPFNNCGFIATSVYFDRYDFSLIHIGSDVYLTHDVLLLVHDQSSVTCWNACSEGNKNKGSFYSTKEVNIGNNVFIGMRSIVLPGTTIGDNVIIGAGSVVKGYLPDNTVWAGNPAKRIQGVEEYWHKLHDRGFFEIEDCSDIKD